MEKGNANINDLNLINTNLFKGKAKVEARGFHGKLKLKSKIENDEFHVIVSFASDRHFTLQTFTLFGNKEVKQYGGGYGSSGVLFKSRNVKDALIEHYLTYDDVAKKISNLLK